MEERNSYNIVADIIKEIGASLADRPDMWVLYLPQGTVRHRTKIIDIAPNHSRETASIVNFYRDLSTVEEEYLYKAIGKFSRLEIKARGPQTIASFMNRLDPL